MQSPCVAVHGRHRRLQAVVDGKAPRSPASRLSNATTLVIKLTKAAPDFLARLTMPFFQAIPNDLAKTLIRTACSRTPVVRPVLLLGLHAEPVDHAQAEPELQGLRRPAQRRQIRSTSATRSTRSSRTSSRAGRLCAGVPADGLGELASKYGVNKGRLFVKPQLGISYLAMNHDRPLFKNNPKLAKAVNWAIDRQAILAQRGFLGRQAHRPDPSAGMPGVQGLRRLPAEGHGEHDQEGEDARPGNTRDGKAVIWTSNRAPAPRRPQIVQFNLKQIGIDVEVKLFARAVQHREGRHPRRGRSTSRLEGWVADYPIRTTSSTSCSGRSQHRREQQLNVAYFNNPKFNKPMIGRVEARPATPAASAYAGPRQEHHDQDRRLGGAVQLQRPPLRCPTRTGGFVFQHGVPQATTRPVCIK